MDCLLLIVVLFSINAFEIGSGVQMDGRGRVSARPTRPMQTDQAANPAKCVPRLDNPWYRPGKPFAAGIDGKSCDESVDRQIESPLYKKCPRALSKVYCDSDDFRDECEWKFTKATPPWRVIGNGFDAYGTELDAKTGQPELYNCTLISKLDTHLTENHIPKKLIDLLKNNDQAKASDCKQYLLNNQWKVCSFGYKANGTYHAVTGVSYGAAVTECEKTPIEECQSQPAVEVQGLQLRRCRDFKRFGIIGKTKNDVGKNDLVESCWSNFCKLATTKANEWRVPDVGTGNCSLKDVGASDSFNKWYVGEQCKKQATKGECERLNTGKVNTCQWNEPRKLTVVPWRETGCGIDASGTVDETNGQRTLIGCKVTAKLNLHCNEKSNVTDILEPLVKNNEQSEFADCKQYLTNQWNVCSFGYKANGKFRNRRAAVNECVKLTSTECQAKPTIESQEIQSRRCTDLIDFGIYSTKAQVKSCWNDFCKLASTVKK